MLTAAAPAAILEHLSSLADNLGLFSTAIAPSFSPSLTNVRAASGNIGGHLVSNIPLNLFILPFKLYPPWYSNP